MLLSIYIAASILGEVSNNESQDVPLAVAVARVRKIKEENQQEDIDHDDEKEDNNNNSNPDEQSGIDNNQSLVSIEGARQLMKISEVGTTYYRDREYKGLEASASVDQQLITNVVIGQSGLPSGYTYNSSR